MEQLGLFDLGGGTIYDADEDIFIELNKNIRGGKIGGKFHNPIEKAIRDIKKEDKLNEWLRTKGPAELAKYMEKFLFTVKVITRLGPELIEKGIIYKQNYNKAIELINSYKPVLNAYKKSGYESMGKEAVSKSIDYKPDKNIDPSKVDPLLVKGLTPFFKNSIEYKKEEPEYKFDNIIDYNDDDSHYDNRITEVEEEEIRTDPIIMLLEDKQEILEKNLDTVNEKIDELELESINTNNPKIIEENILKINDAEKEKEELEIKQKNIIIKKKNKIEEKKREIIKKKKKGEKKVFLKETSSNINVVEKEEKSELEKLQEEKKQVAEQKKAITAKISQLLKTNNQLYSARESKLSNIEKNDQTLHDAIVLYRDLEYKKNKVPPIITKEENKKLSDLLKRSDLINILEYVKKTSDQINKNEKLISDNRLLWDKLNTRTTTINARLRQQITGLGFKGEGYVTSIEKLKSIEKVYNANFKKDRQAPMLRDRRQTKRDYSLLRRKDINKPVSIEEKARNRTNYGNRKIIPSMYNRY